MVGNKKAKFLRELLRPAQWGVVKESKTNQYSISTKEISYQLHFSQGIDQRIAMLHYFSPFMLQQFVSKMLALIIQLYFVHLLYVFRIERMARNIHEDIGGEPIVLLCILKGGYQFCEDLLKFIKHMNANSGMAQFCDKFHN